MSIFIIHIFDTRKAGKPNKTKIIIILKTVSQAISNDNLDFSC